MVGGIIVFLVNLCIIVVMYLLTIMLLIVFNEEVTFGWVLCSTAFSVWIITGNNMFLLLTGLFSISGTISGLNNHSNNKNASEKENGKD